jgi:uncharacterized protein (DUF2252 family)
VKTAIAILIAATVATGTLLLKKPAAPSFSLDLLRETYEPHTLAGDPLGFPLKVRSVARNPENFWGGAKEVFHRWCGLHVADWLGDKETIFVLHGDAHFGNIGVYPAAGRRGGLAFGMIDFDDTHRLPFQMELLEGMVNLRLIARRDKINLDESRDAKLARILFDQYAAAAASHQPPAEMLADEPWVAKLIRESDKRKLRDELKEYGGDKGPLTAEEPKKGDAPREILRPAADKLAMIAQGLAQAVEHSEHLRKQFRPGTAEEFRAAIRDIRERRRPGSSGSQGLPKYLVLIERPLRDYEHNAILYVTLQIPSAAERVGLAARDARPAAQRLVEDVHLLIEPDPWLLGWFSAGQDSYHVTLREPWTEKLTSDRIDGFDELIRAARIWAVALGSTHRQPGQAKIISDRLTAELSGRLRRLSAEYLEYHLREFERFKDDPRVRQLSVTADRAINEASGR